MSCDTCGGLRFRDAEPGESHVDGVHECEECIARDVATVLGTCAAAVIGEALGAVGRALR